MLQGKKNYTCSSTLLFLTFVSTPADLPCESDNGFSNETTLTIPKSLLHELNVEFPVSRRPTENGCSLGRVNAPPCPPHHIATAAPSLASSWRGCVSRSGADATVSSLTFLHQIYFSLNRSCRHFSTVAMS